jgi:thiamine-monophosphate kinase
VARLSDIGEFALIERLAARIHNVDGGEIVVGVGDDAAVWKAGDQYLIGTTDTMVEGVHFVPLIAPWQDVGWKAMASNVSDVAAMGGWPPIFALVTLAMPPETDVTAAETLYAGLAECARTYGVSIVGGDMVRSPQISVTVALIATAKQHQKRPRIMRRDKAQPGDAIAVTGTLGDSAGGLQRLQDGARPDDPLARRHLHPEPRLYLGADAATRGILCAIDVSDGLLQDIGHVCARSGVGAIVEAKDIPLSAELRRGFGKDALKLACTGGEDYELVLVGRPPIIEKLAKEQTAAPLTVIGKIVSDPAHRVRLMNEKGGEMRFKQAGWDAFR